MVKPAVTDLTLTCVNSDPCVFLGFRFMVAARDINPLELILIEEPAVVGPYSKSSIGCLQCFKKVDGTYRCRRCQFPMCGDVCASGRLHETECK